MWHFSFGGLVKYFSVANIVLPKRMLAAGLSQYAGGAVVIFPVVVVGYLLNSIFVFMDKK